MSVILKKERILAGEVICQKYSQTTVDCDVIVPDIKPDILKILDVSGFVSVKEKSVRSGKVYIQGTVKMTVLYAPDGDVISRAKSLSSEQEFNHSIDVSGADGDALLLAEVEAESFGYSLINSRKVNLRCAIGMNVKLTRADEFEVATDTESDDDICIESKQLRLCNFAINCEGRISVCEQLELPSGKPTIGEILKNTATVQSVELTLLDGKAVAKGQVKICTLYTSADDGSIQFVEHTLPFGEIIDATGAEEDMEGEIEYSVCDMYCEARDDSDGEARIIGVDIGICAIVKGLLLQEPRIIVDAYSLIGTTTLSTQEKVIEELLDNTTAQLTHKVSVSRPEQLPEISQVCDISAVASVDRISAEKGEITLFGSIKCCVLYVTNDPEIPLASFTDSSEFSHTFHVNGADEHTICEAKIYTEHISYTISGSDSLDTRIVLGLNVRSFRSETISQITDISVSEPDDTKRRPCIIMYFVQSGDTLWNIAKRYRTTVEALKECNNLTDDTLQIGQEIRICRKKCN